MHEWNWAFCYYGSVEKGVIASPHVENFLRMTLDVAYWHTLLMMTAES